MDSIVKTIGLSHRYATAWAVRDINIDINKKGIFGLLGSNGAGKSTIMNIMCGVLNQTMGEVYINGINLHKNPIAAKKQLGFLPQTAPLYTDLTVREYLEYSGRLRLMDKQDIPASVEEVMKKCNISNVSDRLLKNLSGGYRQRVGFAQAIIHKPKLVILDEPTNGLDPLLIAEVRNLIKEIALEHTVILSSHLLSEIQLLCQEIIMIEQGQLVFCDTMEAFNNYMAPQTMLASFEAPPSEEILGAIAGVTRVEKLTTQTFRLYHDDDRLLSEKVISESVQRQWRIKELVIEKKSMDEIFKQLTGKAIKK